VNGADDTETDCFGGKFRLALREGQKEKQNGGKEMNEKMKGKKKVLTVILSCLTIALMLCFASQTVRAQTYIINQPNTIPYLVGGYETGSTQYCSYNVQPGNAYGYVQVSCSHTSSTCFYMEAQGVYSGTTQSVTVYMYVYVSGMSTSLSGNGIAVYYMQLIDVSTGKTVYTNTNVNWNPIVAGDGWETYSVTTTMTNGNTYQINCGPYVGSTGSASNSADAIGTVTSLEVYY